MDEQAQQVAQQVGVALQARGWTLATAESCTGGLIGALVTMIPGSSAYYQGGVISYSNDVKIAQLGVPAEVIATVGAVSDACARAMVEGVRQRFGTDIAVATTGIAGPGGGTATKPVGLVYIAIATPEQTEVQRYLFAGERGEIQQATALTALERVLASCERTN